LDETSVPWQRTRRRRWWGLVTGLVIVSVALVLGGTAWWSLSTWNDPFRDLALDVRPAERGRLLFTIVEKGELEAARNTDIVCKVRAGGRGSTVSSTIKWVIDDGSRVRKGDIVVRLDDSGLREAYLNQQGIVAEKRNLLIQAEKDREIVLSQNRSELQAAENNVKLAELNLKKYLEGDLQQKRKDIDGRITLAEANLMQWREKALWSSRMVKKGYISASQAQSDEANLRSAEINLEMLREEKRVLDFYERQLNILDLQNKLAQAQEALNVARIQAKAKEAQADAKYQAAVSVLRQEEAKLADLEEDIRNCTIAAPNDGMVVYYVPEQSRFGAGSVQSIIAVGEPVREGQKLMRIPDLRHMQVRVKIHESLVPRLRADVIRSTGFGSLLYAACAVGLRSLTDLPSFLTAPEVRDQYSDLEEEIVEYGLPAQVQVASLDRPLEGHVKMVSAVASSTDWMSADVKVYQTVVAIDEQVEGLKPGMSAVVTIFVEELEDVLRIPVHAVFESGGQRFCYVKTQSGIEKRRLTTGLNNNMFVEIRDGSELRDGELVVQNARSLAERLGDLHATGAGEETSRRGLGKTRAPNGKGQTPARAGKANGALSDAAAPAGGRPADASDGSPRDGSPNKFSGQNKKPPSPEEAERRKQMFQQMLEKFKSASPAERKAMIEQMPVPDEVKQRIRDNLRKQGLEIPD